MRHRKLLGILGLFALLAGPVPGQLRGDCLPAGNLLEVFLKEDGEYCLQSKGANIQQINSGHIASLLSGNLFSLLPQKELRINKSAGQLKTELLRPGVIHSRISAGLLREINPGASTLSPPIPLDIILARVIVIHFNSLSENGKPIVRINKIEGLQLQQTALVRSRRLAQLLNVDRYRILLGKEANFFGVLYSGSQRRFTYHTYTSARDIKKRGVGAVLLRPNLELRKKIKPLVATF